MGRGSTFVWYVFVVLRPLEQLKFKSKCYPVYTSVRFSAQNNGEDAFFPRVCLCLWEENEGKKSL